MRIIPSFFRCHSGSAAIEFSIVGMVFLMLCAGTLEFGRALNVRSDILRAVDVAERKVLLDSSVTEGEIAATVRSEFRRGDPQELSINVSTETASGTAFRRIDVAYDLQIYLIGYSGSIIAFDVTRRVPIS